MNLLKLTSKREKSMPILMNLVQIDRWFLIQTNNQCDLKTFHITIFNRRHDLLDDSGVSNHFADTSAL